MLAYIADIVKPTTYYLYEKAVVGVSYNYCHSETLKYSSAALLKWTIKCLK